jgi:hypothetical protein
MTPTRSEGSAALTGNVRDQAELEGLLRRVSDVELTVLEVQALDDRLQELRGRGTDQETRTQLGTKHVLPGLTRTGADDGYRCSLDPDLMEASRGPALSRAMDGVRWWMTRP